MGTFFTVLIVLSHTGVDREKLVSRWDAAQSNYASTLKVWQAAWQRQKAVQRALKCPKISTTVNANRQKQVSELDKQLTAELGQIGKDLEGAKNALTKARKTVDQATQAVVDQMTNDLAACVRKMSSTECLVFWNDRVPHKTDSGLRFAACANGHYHVCEHHKVYQPFLKQFKASLHICPIAKVLNMENGTVPRLIADPKDLKSPLYCGVWVECRGAEYQLFQKGVRFDQAIQVSCSSTLEEESAVSSPKWKEIAQFFNGGYGVIELQVMH